MSTKHPINVARSHCLDATTYASSLEQSGLLSFLHPAIAARLRGSCTVLGALCPGCRLADCSTQKQSRKVSVSHNRVVKGVSRKCLKRHDGVGRMSDVKSVFSFGSLPGQRTSSRSRKHHTSRSSSDTAKTHCISKGYLSRF